MPADGTPSSNLQYVSLCTSGAKSTLFITATYRSAQMLSPVRLAVRNWHPINITIGTGSHSGSQALKQEDKYKQCDASTPTWRLPLLPAPRPPPPPPRPPRQRAATPSVGASAVFASAAATALQRPLPRPSRGARLALTPG